MRIERAPWIGWLLVCWGVFIAAVALPPFISELRRALHDPPSLGLDERLSSVQSAQASWLIEQKGGHWGRYGWYLAGGEEGLLRIRLPGSVPGRLKLRLWVYDAGPLTVHVQGAEPGSRYEIPGGHLDGRIISLPIAGPSELVLVASSHLSEEQLLMDRFSAVWFSDSDRLPALWPFALALALCLAGWGWIIVARSYGLENSPHFHLSPKGSEHQLGKAFQHGGAGGVRSWQLWFGCVAILAAAAVGWAQRWELFDMTRGLPADPDVRAYIGYARSLDWFTQEHGFYSGTFNEREPLHVAGLNLWFRLWGDTFPAIMLYTVCLSTLLIAVSGVFLWALSGQWLLGVLASWIMALSPAWIDEAVRGLRLESMTFMFLAVLSVWQWARGWLGAVMLGVMTGLAALVQSPALGVIVPLIWLGWILNLWRKRQDYILLTPSHWRWEQLTLASVIAVMAFVPHFYGLYKVHGDPAWPSYGYARWNANWEFPDRHGTPGFPTTEELAANPYAGPRITYSEYLFGLHSIPTLVLGQIKGWVESTGYMSVSATPHLKGLVFLHHASGYRAVFRHLNVWTGLIFVVSFGLTVTGWTALWRTPQYWWVPFLSLWGTWYAAYLYSVRLVEPFRHTGHVYPLLLFCFLWGGYRCVQFFKNVRPVDLVGISKTISDPAS